MTGSPLDAEMPGAEVGVTVLDWIRRRVEKVQHPDAIDNWPKAWAEAYREDVPLLVAEVDRLRGELERLREELAAAEEYGEECLRRMGGTW